MKQLALDASEVRFWEYHLHSGAMLISDCRDRLLGARVGQIPDNGTNWLDLLHPDDREAALSPLQACLNGAARRYEAHFRLGNEHTGWLWHVARGIVARQGIDNAPLRLVGTLVAVSQRQEEAHTLRQTATRLQEKVTRLASDLSQTETALNVLLKKREQDRWKLQEQFTANVRQLLDPLIHKLNKTALDVTQQQLLSTIEASLQDITTPLVTRLSGRSISLTPTEIQVANHVKLGKSTKEIADTLCLAPGTVNVHRKKIRKKLGITNKPVNLRTMLSTLSEK